MINCLCWRRHGKLSSLSTTLCLWPGHPAVWQRVLRKGQDRFRRVLGGKSPATLPRRLSQLTRFAKWAREEANRLPFPLTSELIKNYIRYLRNIGSGHTAFKGFAEVLKFEKHVVGLSALDSAWVSGIIRAAQQQKPLRKQSTTLWTWKPCSFWRCTSAIWRSLWLIALLQGFSFFAIYSRARYGDLRRIAKIIIDEVSESNESSLGFIEMLSESHKMRATGNRLGAHLPLIAPTKGLSEIAWGREFIKISRLAGLDIGDWCQSRPLAPAPTQVGDWTDRAVTTLEVGMRLRGIVAKCTDFDPTGFTPHGCKATTLIMLSKYGASLDDRLVLGHHQLHNGALEVYSRDLQSAPLRVLEHSLWPFLPRHDKIWIVYTCRKSSYFEGTSCGRCQSSAHDSRWMIFRNFRRELHLPICQCRVPRCCLTLRRTLRHPQEPMTATTRRIRCWRGHKGDGS